MHYNHSLNFFINFVYENHIIGYWILFFMMFIEGELFLLAAGMFVRIGSFGFMDAFLIAFCGVIASDIAWYLMGKYLNNKHSKNRYLNFIIRRVKKLFPNIEKNPWHIIFVSKFFYGLNHSTILALGFLNVPFKHFMRIQFFTSLFWVLIFFLLGYIFGGAAIAFTHRLDKLLIIVSIFFIIFIFFEKIMSLFISKRRKNN